MRIDYAFKAEVLKGNLTQEQKDIALSLYAHSMLLETGLYVPCKYDYETAEQKRSFYMENQPREWKEAERINYAFYKRVKRLKEKITQMLNNGKCLFLTLTFTDKVLESTSPETRRRYVAYYLKQFGVPYIANIDFGTADAYIDDNGNERQGTKREHYHAVIQTDKITLDDWHKYGAIKLEKIRTTKNDNIRLAKYVSKLTNHAIKETTKRSCLIYSRD